jgi:hypothetical protein
MPWSPSYTEADARAAISFAQSWQAVLRALGLGYHGKNIETLHRWAKRWGISTDHLSDRRGRKSLAYREADLRAAIAKSRSWAEALRRLGYCLKQPECELCGQGESWRGKRMGMILDHANGVRDDNRLENLRIVCPNCAATLETHCGRKNREPVSPRACLRCSADFVPKHRAQRYCSRECGSRWDRSGVKRPGARKVERPPHDVLLREVNRLGYLAVGRKYGVSDNAIRKWLRQYERDQLLAEGKDPVLAEIPTRTWPNRRRGQEDAAA